MEKRIGQDTAGRLKRRIETEQELYPGKESLTSPQVVFTLL